MGRKLEIDGVPFEVIGVMPSDFAFPAKESQSWSQAKDTQLWLPIDSDARWSAFQRFRIADAFGVVARLRENATTDQAQAEMSAIANQLARVHPDADRYLGVHVVFLAIYLVGSRVRLTLALLMCAVIAVLLMACANVAGLFVSRTFRRRQAVAIQMALGAGRADILRQDWIANFSRSVKLPSKPLFSLEGRAYPTHVGRETQVSKRAPNKLSEGYFSVLPRRHLFQRNQLHTRVRGHSLPIARTAS